jgi:NAD(P)-dependent dehydrogenase (short-subunit alcohol dehydrogenase family)
MDLREKAIVITGAAQGLGEKMAEALSAEDVNLALGDVEEADLKKTVDLLQTGNQGQKLRSRRGRRAGGRHTL